MKPLKILLYGDCFQGRFEQGLDYLTFLQPYGHVILVTPANMTPELVEYGDLLVLPGGADVDPFRYGEKPSPRCGRANPQYEWMDTQFLPQWIETGKPIVGICRGCQTLNVALGGTLIQHLIGHTGGEDRTEKHHFIYTDFADIEGKDFRLYGTNSYHHQGIKELAPGFKVLGWSTIFKNCPSIADKIEKKKIYTNYHWKKTDKKGIDKYVKEKDSQGHVGSFYSVPEIVKHETKPYIAFQYHPENTNCQLAHHLIAETLSGHFGEE